VGFLPGDLSRTFRSQSLRQVGGAIIIEGQSTDGKLVIELFGFKRDTTYLTGLIVEPLKEVSDVVLSQPALRKQVSLRSRLTLESQILSAAADAVDGIIPDAGKSFEDENSATTN
tara:strand:- start:23740 stop:24084 length:345 start_codon:yes stop_codon:yes gene_type:complete